MFVKVLFTIFLLTFQLSSDDGEAIGNNLKKLRQNDGFTPQTYPEQEEKSLNTINSISDIGLPFPMPEGGLVTEGYGDVSEKEEVPKREVKFNYSDYDTRNFKSIFKRNQIFIGHHGQYPYDELKEYGTFVSNRYPDTKENFKKYRDYELFLKFYNFVYPKIYIETDVPNPKIQIEGVLQFKQGMPLEREKPYNITITTQNGEKVSKWVNYYGDKIVILFNDSPDILEDELIVESEEVKFEWQNSRSYKGIYPEAKSYCNELIFDGKDDWRLPTLKELWHVVNREKGSKSVDLISDKYWSGSEIDRNRVYGVDIKTGSDKILKRSSLHYARCVRGSIQKYGDFSNSGDGTVLDSKNRKMWFDQSSGRSKNWKDANFFCQDLVFLNKSDWRLPTIEELYSITNSGKICSKFENIKPNWYWSSTNFITNRNKFWNLNTTTGMDTWDSSSRKILTTCIRDN